MLRRSLLLLALFPLAACDGMGGSEGTGGSETSFVILSRTPSPGSPTVPVTATVVITFNTPIDAASVGSGTLATNVPTFGDLTIDGTKLRFTPAGDLIAGTTYIFTLDPDLRGTNAQVLGTIPPWGFKTAGTAPPPDTLPPSGPRPR